MRLVDTHCHLQDSRFDPDRDEVLERALERLDWIVVIGDTLASSREAVALVRNGVYASAGIHPHHASDACEEKLAAIRALAGAPGVVALGEIGLDYHYDFAPRDSQRSALLRQLDMAAELRLPVILHSREADDDMAAILAEHAPALVGGVMHCFSSGAGLADACLELGFYVSFGGIVTFPKAQNLRDLAAAVPLDRMLVETDSPYLAPPPHRGKRCEPVYVEHTAQVLADLKGIGLDAFANITTSNAAQLFAVPHPGIL